ncbi:MAG: hypothetical protein IPK08_06280 [Bacteroidetes bacterium]|nr:hypothetical protein [Bacteroidota bacterium]
MKIHGIDTDLFYLFHDINDQKQPICSLTNSEIDELNASNKALHEFQYQIRRILEIQLNLSEFQQTVVSNIESVEKMKESDLNKDIINEMFVNVNRTFINFITSMTVFVDHIEILLKRKYGASSTQYTTFKKQLSYIYDYDFSYKLFFNLRNYAIHNTYPIDSVKIEFEKISNKSELQPSLLIEFNKIKLLKDAQIEKKLKLDLKKCGNLFPVRFLMYEIEKPLKKIFNQFLQIEKGFYIEHANISIAYLKKYPNSINLGFGKITGDNRLAKMEAVLIPIFIISKLKEKLSELN